MIPIYKTGDRVSVGSYRPIRLVPTFSKILEKVVYNKLLVYFNNHCLLIRAQFGFRPKMSTEKISPFSVRGFIYPNCFTRNYVVGIFFYLTKAFDLVNLPILFKKLAYDGIRSIAHSWFTIHISDREHSPYIHHSQLKEKAYHSSFYFWPHVILTSRYQPF